MSVFIRSLINTSQTIDAVALPAFALQERGNVTSAIQTASDQRKINLWAGSVDVRTTQSFLEYVPVTTDVIALPAYAEDVSIVPAGTIAALTLTLPLAPRDRQRLNVTFDTIVTTLTMQVATGSSHTLRGALTAATARGFATWMYRASNKVWYRIG